MSLVVGCAGPASEPEAPASNAGFSWGAALPCPSPTAGLDRFVEEGASRGLTWAYPHPISYLIPQHEGEGGALVAEDLDADGDSDLLFLHLEYGIQVALNDGTGHFSLGDVSLAEFEVRMLGVADFDADVAPDLITAGAELVIRRGQGDGSFEAPELIRTLPPLSHYQAFTFGDLDDDGDVDVLLVGQVRSPDGMLPTPPWLFWNDGRGVFSAPTPLLRDDAEGVTSQAAVVFDRDGDGDFDVFVPTQRSGNPSGFWRNDGGSAFVEDAVEIGANVQIAAMGMDHLDWNGDGQLDLCTTDSGPILCLESNSLGYIDVSNVLGLIPSSGRQVGWSFEFIDLDHDGVEDAAQASGPDRLAYEANALEIPDLLWQGLPDGSFLEISQAVGFGDLGADYGLVATDFDGDGSPDLLLNGPMSPPRLYMNRCASGAWTEVDLDGPPGNPAGFGTRITVVAGGRRRVREIWNVRAQGQSPSLAHFGLGEVDGIDQIEVRWPDGTTRVLDDAPLRRRIVAHHPDAGSTD